MWNKTKQGTAVFAAWLRCTSLAQEHQYHTASVSPFITTAEKNECQVSLSLTRADTKGPSALRKSLLGMCIFLFSRAGSP